MSRADLSRVCGYGNNPKRVDEALRVKSSVRKIPEMMQAVTELVKRKTRRDKLSGDPIWEKL